MLVNIADRAHIADVAGGLNEQQRKYFNAVVIGQAQASADPGSMTICSYKQDFDAPLIDNPQEWMVGVVRYTIPSFRIPRFISPEYIPGGTVCQIIWTNPNWTDATGTINVKFDAQPDDPYNKGYVYNVSTVIAAIQTAFNTLTNTVQSTFTSHYGVPLVPPLISYNASTGLISITMTQGVFWPAPGYNNQPIKMFFNQSLWSLIPTFPGQFYDFTANNKSSAQYYLISAGNSTNTNPPVILAAPSNINVPTFTSNDNQLQIGSLAGALTAGNNYTQLAISPLAPLVPGQALTIVDTTTGTPQTVFVGGTIPGPTNPLTVVDTLIFTASVAFAAGSPVYLNDCSGIFLASGSLVYIPSATELTINGQVFTTTRDVNVGDTAIYCKSWRPINLTANYTISYLTPPSDVCITQTPAPPIWTAVSSIRMKTQYLPIIGESSPAIVQGSVGTQVAQATVTNTLNPIMMLADFVITSPNQLQTNNVIQFVTDQPRWIELVGTNPVRTIDVACYWVDEAGIEHPIYIPASFRFDLKLEFKRKFTTSQSGL